MITFVMYVPGSKGKFITEICDLLAEKQKKNNFETAGFVQWADEIKYTIDNDTNGIFPEEDHHQEYIQRIVNLAGNKTIHVDTHYTRISTIKYLLENNHKVIFIDTANSDRSELTDNFYYKNFIAPFYTGRDKTSQVKSLLTNNHQTIKQINDDDFALVSTYFSKPFYQWSRECFDICYKMVKGSTNPATLNEQIIHDNFLRLEYKNIGNEQTLQRIADFMSNGKITASARDRFNKYSKSQEFGTYNEFIEKFVIDFRDKNIV